MLLFAPLLPAHVGDDRVLLDAVDASPAVLPGFDLALLAAMLRRYGRHIGACQWASPVESAPRYFILRLFVPICSGCSYVIAVNGRASTVRPLVGAPPATQRPLTHARTLSRTRTHTSARTRACGRACARMHGAT